MIKKKKTQECMLWASKSCHTSSCTNVFPDTKAAPVKPMEVLEGESLCGSLLWLERRRSKSNWLLLLPSFSWFTSFPANDWQLLYYGQTLKDKLNPPVYVGAFVSYVCACVDVLGVYVWTDRDVHAHSSLKSTLQMWREVWVHLMLIQSASQHYV